MPARLVDIAVTVLGCRGRGGCLDSDSLLSHSTSQQIQSGEKKDPHQIDEVPVQPGHFNAIRIACPIRLPHLRAGKQEIEEDDNAAENVQAMQAGHCEIDGHEVARPRVAMHLELVAILESLVDQEDDRAQESAGDEEPATHHIAQAEICPRQNYSDARSDQYE